MPRWLIVMAPTIAMVVGIAVSWGFQQATTQQHEKRLTRIEKSLEDLAVIRTDLKWVKEAINK